MSYLVYQNLAELNAVERDDAVRIFSGCLGSARWAEQMEAARPFSMVEHLFSKAEDVWFCLPTVDQLEVFNQNDVIAGLTDALGGDVKSRLTELLASYQQKFGFAFVASVNGRSAEEVLAIAAARLRNSAQTELSLAAEEQNKILQIRLAQMLER